MTIILPTFMMGLMAVMLLFLGIWCLFLRTHNAGIVDVGWGVGFIILCGIDTLRGQGLNLRDSMLFLMVALWGLRISFFLIKRIIHEGQEDKRYQALRAKWKGHVHLKFLLFFEFQALLQTIIALPFLTVSRNIHPNISWIEIAGIIIFSGALIGESVADEQLHSFKKDPQHKDKTCDQGLWYYSRHPNYFFEWLIWMGIFIYALASPWGWAGILSPVLMYILVRYVSGIPLAEEQALKSRGENYRRYQQRTSAFFPMPKAKENA